MVRGIRIAAPGLALLALVLLALSGPLLRFEVVGLSAAFRMFRWAAYLGIAAAALSALVLAVPRLRARGIAAPAFALLLGLAVFYVPFQFQSRARSVPAINDISTDTANPPQFMTTRRAYPGEAVARQQRAAYPDLAPLALPLAPPEAFAKAVKTAEAMGWEVVGRDAEKGTLEAVDTTKWFGFRDDIAVRVTAAPAGSASRSLVDVRSKSRVGQGDLGTNAQRIRAYLERLK